MNLEKPITQAVRQSVDLLKESKDTINIPVPKPWMVNAAIAKTFSDWHANVTPKFLGATLVGTVASKNFGTGIANGLASSAYTLVNEAPTPSKFIKNYEAIKRDGYVTVAIPIVHDIKTLANTNERELVQLGVKYLTEHVGTPMSKAFNTAMHRVDDPEYRSQLTGSLSSATQESKGSRGEKGNLQQTRDLSTTSDELPLFGTN